MMILKKLKRKPPLLLKLNLKHNYVQQIIILREEEKKIRKKIEKEQILA